MSIIPDPKVMDAPFALQADPEVSTIQPTEEEIRKKVKSKKIKPDNIEFNDRAYKSYLENGFDPTDDNQVMSPRRQRLDFLSRVDLSKGPFKRKIVNIQRIKEPDYDNEGNETKPKEWIVYREFWDGKDWLNHRMTGDNTEGVYKEQTKELDTTFDPKTGDVNAVYKRGRPRDRHYIPFSKKAVDEILAKLGTDPSEILWYGKFRNSANGPGFRCANFTYEQLVKSEWEDFEDLARRPGGPTGKVKMIPADKKLYIG